MRKRLSTLTAPAMLLLSLAAPELCAADYDVVVYGGTSAGVIAAVQAKKMGKSAIIVGPDKHLGGLSSGGPGWTDSGNQAVIGGLSREFYHRVWRHYNRTDAWMWQRREDYGNKGQGTPAMDGEQRTMWIFEPHVAEKIFEGFVNEHQIPIHRDEWLDRAQGVKKTGARLASKTMLSGRTYAGKMFIDATYEGDLMAAADVDYHVGREANRDYGEQWNGVQTGVLHRRHHFGVLGENLSPYVVPGDLRSGVLARISTNHPGAYGQGDKKVQAYCYRYCLTDHPDNRIPFPRPDSYDPRPTPESVGMGSYGIDSHNVQRYITPEGYVQNEGDIGIGLEAPYAIAYGALVPKKHQAENLLVPVCVSSTHIAFGSIRMEPVFMILGQSAATAAVLAIDGNRAVQDLRYAQLRKRLLQDGQVLEYVIPARE